MDAVTLNMAKKYAKSYCDTYLTSGSEYKGMISAVTDIPTTASVGDFYICDFDDTTLGIVKGCMIIFNSTTTYNISTFIEKGDKGDKGDVGNSIEYIWSGTSLGIREEGQSDYSYSDLKGEQGIQGLQGEQGIQGIQGIKGDKGDKGDAGLKGDKGDKGDTGSAFAISKVYSSQSELISDLNPVTEGLMVAVIDTTNANVYIRNMSIVADTETGDLDNYKYLTNLTDATVIKGDQGIQGEKGEKGDTGDQGVQGVQGEQGIQGIQGIKGDSGFTPTISVNTETATEYKLDITNSNGTITTPNLKGGSGTGGGTNVTASEINGNIIVDEAELKVYDDTQVTTDIASLNARSVIGANPRFCTLKNSATQSLTPNTIVKFDTVVGSNGDISYNLANNSIKLTKGTIWDIRVTVITGTSGYTYFQIINADTGEAITSRFSAISPNYNGTANSNSHVSIPYKCEKDMNICVKVIATGTTVQNLNAGDDCSTFSVLEVSTTYIVDPIEYAQDHDIKASTLRITSNKAINSTTPLVFDTTNGNISLTADGYIQLTANTTYMIGACVYQAPNATEIALYDVTNSTKILPIGINCFMSAPITYTPTTDMKVSIVADTNTTVSYQYSYLTIQEIKNPVLYNYTSNLVGFSKTTLLEGNANAIGTYFLLDNVSNYDFLYLEIEGYNYGSSTSRVSTMYVEANILKEHAFYGYDTRNIVFDFKKNNSLNIISIGNTADSTVAILKIMGIKGLPSYDYSQLSTTQVTQLKTKLGIS